MTAANKDIPTDKLGDEDIPDPALLSFPVEAGTRIFGGTMVATNAAGNAVPAGTSGALVVWGRCEAQVDNTLGVAGALTVDVRKGSFYLAQDGTISQSSVGRSAYVVDDSTVSLSDGGGTRILAGVIYPIAESQGFLLTGSKKAPVWLGLPNAFSSATGASPGAARNLVTSLSAYGGTGTGTLTAAANGAWPTQGGVTNVVGDTVFVQGGTTNLSAAADSGPWTIASLGGTTSPWVLSRPAWFAPGRSLEDGMVVELGGEGSVWGGTSWKSFCPAGSVVGVDDPAFYVGRVVLPVVLNLGQFVLTTVGIRSATKSSLVAQLRVAGGTITTTVGYGTLTAVTPGYAGTASASISAIAAGMTTQTGDASSLNVLIVNW